MKNPPPGYRPPGWEPKPGAATGKADIPTRDMLKTPTFYALWIAYCLGATAGLMMISQLVPFARNSGLTATQATLAITVGAFGNAGGRILSGWMSDAFGRLPTLRIDGARVGAGDAGLLPRARAAAAVLPSTAVVYWCYGTQLSVFASTTADLYGTKHLGMNYGVLFTAWGAAGILGPAIAARVFDAVRQLPLCVLCGFGDGAGGARVVVDGKTAAANGNQLKRRISSSGSGRA